MGLKACSQIVVTIVLINILIRRVEGDGNIDRFVIETKFHTTDGNCVRSITITGNGVTDSLAVHSCSDYGETIIQENGAMVYGHWPKDSFYLFSDKRSTLVIVEDEGCEMVEYTGTDKHRSTMDKENCKTVQKKIADLTSASYFTKTSESWLAAGSDPGNTKKDDARVSKTWVYTGVPFKSWVQSWWMRYGKKKFDPNSFDVKTKSYNEDDQCIRDIEISGNGFNKVFKVECSAYVETIVREGGALVYGFWPNDSFYLFSDSFGTMVVIQDGDCTKYTSTDTDVESSSMGDAECSTVKARIEKLSYGSSWFANILKRVRESLKFQLL